MMTIEEYIDKNITSRHIRKGGLEYLVSNWRDRVGYLPAKSNYMLEEYIGVELGMRHCIQEILLNCNVPEDIKKDIDEADKEFKKKTIALDIPIFFSYEKMFDDYENYWFYYRVPYKYISDKFFLDSLIVNLQGYSKKEFPSHECDLRILEYADKNVLM